MHKISIRRPENSDREFIYDLENSPENLSITTGMDHPLSHDEINILINRHKLSEKVFYFIIYLQGLTMESAGIVNIFNYDPVNARAEIGIILKKDMQAKGLGPAAIKQAVSYCFEKLFLQSVYASVKIDNLNSFKAFKRAGFIHTGTLRDWMKVNSKSFLDIYLMQRFNDETYGN